MECPRVDEWFVAVNGGSSRNLFVLVEVEIMDSSKCRPDESTPAYLTYVFIDIHSLRK
jgi:hypothetical protein